MPKASIKRNINCSKKDLIDLVLNIEEYPKFIPYCLNAQIYKDVSEGNFQYIEADLTIGKGPFKDTYKSDVKFDKKESIIYVKNIEGPLKYLENKWKFDQKDNFTEVTFDLDFESCGFDGSSRASLAASCCCSFSTSRMRSSMAFGQKSPSK